MDSIAMADRLLAQLGNDLGLRALGLSGRGVAALRFDERVTMHYTIDEAGRSLRLQCCIGSVEDGEEALLRALLGANASRADTAGGVFSLAGEHLDRLWLTWSLPVDADYPRLRETQDQALKSARLWQQALQAEPAGAVPAFDLRGMQALRA